jgi:hypothetical protein
MCKKTLQVEEKAYQKIGTSEYQIQTTNYKLLSPRLKPLDEEICVKKHENSICKNLSDLWKSVCRGFEMNLLSARG